ncbi:hypothetical protein LIER_21775 [Lithospermum erythrorhizon]|uniref:Uncharacterized protein n=1 Tax=Lithospermum erythrorhizon TaxID=34254 RepID=A0AAV3QUI8_LITER
MEERNKTTILDSFQVAPSKGAVAELAMPLTCSDMLWIDLPPVHRLTFYQSPVSKPFFLETIIPGLKNSLSLALKHFPSLSGNLIMHSDGTKPLIRYVEGNSVPFTIAEYNVSDFEYLVSNQPRNCGRFYPLIPQMPKSTESAGSKMYPLIAFQVTLFPGEGLCIGITHNHVLGDAASTYSFIKAWSTISKYGEDEAAKRNELSPSYDREVMRIHTEELDEIFWKDVRNKNLKEESETLAEDTDMVRTTFVISMDDVQKLKKHVSERRRSIEHLSTFTVVCAYVWTCLINSTNGTILDVDEDDQYIVFAIDCRGRTDPLIPRNYFGNCLGACMIRAKTKELCGDEGFLTATELIGDMIHQRSQYNGVFRGLGSILREIGEIKDMNKLFSVAGSPRQNHYNIDFGWGKPRKVEITSIDSTGAMSLGGCRDHTEGLEIGLSLPKKRMDDFTEIFTKALGSL